MDLPEVQDEMKTLQETVAAKPAQSADALMQRTAAFNQTCDSLEARVKAKSDALLKEIAASPAAAAYAVHPEAAQHLERLR